MQTEPIGFKGTKGEWVGIPIFNGTELSAYQIVSEEDIVAVIKPPKYNTEPREESAYDFALMAASKKMAIALQPFKKYADIVLSNSNLDKNQIVFACNKAEITMQDLLNVIEALKQAGL